MGDLLVVGVVQLHVALEDLGAGPENTLEPLAVELGALDVALGRDGGVAGVVGQQRNLAEVGGLLELADLALAVLADDALALDNDEELIPRLALLDHNLAVLKT